jgi:hypothetical protein
MSAPRYAACQRVVGHLGRASPYGQRGSQGRQSVLGRLIGRATSLPFITVLTGSERTTTDNAKARSTCAVPCLRT